MTNNDFDLWRSSRIWAADLSIANGADLGHDGAGYIYSDGYIIEQSDPKPGARYLLIIANCDWVSDDLEELERTLYDEHVVPECGWTPRHVAAPGAFDQLFVDEIALRFVEQLDLTPAELADVRARNVANIGTGICATHDICDANMPMHAAFSIVMGREPDTGSEFDAALWSAAWAVAFDRYLVEKVST